MGKVYGFNKGMYETMKLFFGIKNKDKKENVRVFPNRDFNLTELVDALHVKLGDKDYKHLIIYDKFTERFNEKFKEERANDFNKYYSHKTKCFARYIYTYYGVDLK